MRKLIPVLLLGLVVIASGCVSQGVNEEFVRAKTACVLLCKLAVEDGKDLSKGPCLSDSLLEDWVCDVAHSPRLDVDNNPGNQCQSFGKTSNHFVEVDEYCKVIQIY